MLEKQLQIWGELNLSAVADGFKRRDGVGIPGVAFTGHRIRGKNKTQKRGIVRMPYGPTLLAFIRQLSSIVSSPFSFVSIFRFRRYRHTVVICVCVCVTFKTMRTCQSQSHCRLSFVKVRVLFYSFSHSPFSSHSRFF